jgi:hypothetical protein
MKPVSLFGSVVGLLGLLGLVGCAHHRDVRPGADGVHRVVLKTEDRDEGFRSGMSQAEHYCKERQSGKSPAIVQEGSKYTGSMDEDTYRKGKTISKVLGAAGGAVWVGGGKKERNAGGIVGTGGAIANSALGEGYTFEMKFKCQ